ncbi:MAG: PEP-CTERM sorting domain-containing protein [Proteobacteria bacterium]|nr:PEP-CTERM sorting domain-containing protein [Pseudomonadota bacterium]
MTCNPKIALGVLALASAAAHAQPTLDIYAPPNNNLLVGLSQSGAYGVSYASAAEGNLLLTTATATWTNIGGNSPANGFGGNLGISLDGRSVAGNATAANGFSQAARYDVGAGTWSTLGSLGFNGTSSIQGIKEQSSAVAISADGSTVVGRAYFNTSGTTGSVYHPVVFRGGQVYDLNPAGTTQSGMALASNASGTLIGGYTSNSSIGMLWRWNGSGYDTLAAPTIPNSAGVATNIQTAAISADGTWIAGGSVNGLSTNYGGRFTPITFSPATLWNASTGSGLVIPFDHMIDTRPTSNDVDKNMKTSVAGVSDAGTVIGSFVVNVGGNTALVQSDAWIYDQHTGVSLSFDSYLSDLGLGLAPTQHVWNLFSMSADGSAIAGYFFDTATNTTSAFVLHLAAPVPEPGSLAMFAAALPLLAGYAARRRRRA